MPRDSEAERLTQEWRQSVGDRLDNLYERLNKTNEALTQLMLHSSTNAALGELEKRVRELEKFQIKTMTVIAVVNIAVAIVWALVSFYKK